MYYQKGQCRYGIGGKGCPRSHPSLCRRLMTHGTRGPRGCTKGKSCPRFHPKMCPSSIKHHECLNDACSLYHVKGTRRMNSRPLPENTSDRKIQHSSKKQAKEYEKITTASSDNRDNFLELIHAMKQEILEALDMKIKQARIQAPAPVASPH